MKNNLFNFSTFSSYIALGVVLATGPSFAMDPEDEMLQAAIAASLRDTGGAPAQARARKHLELFGNDDEAMVLAEIAASLHNEERVEETVPLAFLQDWVDLGLVKTNPMAVKPGQKLTIRCTFDEVREPTALSFISSAQNAYYEGGVTVFPGQTSATFSSIVPEDETQTWLILRNPAFDGRTTLPLGLSINKILLDVEEAEGKPAARDLGGPADELVEDVPPLGGIPLTSYTPTPMFDVDPSYTFVTHYPTMAAKGNLQAVIFELLSRLGDGPKSIVFDVDNTLWARDDAFLDDRNVGTRLTNIEWPIVLQALRDAGHIVDLVTARSGDEARNVGRDLAASGIRLGEHYRAVYATQDTTKHDFVERCAEGRPTLFMDDNLSNNLTVAKHFTRLGIPVLSVNVGTLENFGNDEIKMTAEFLASEL